MPHRSHPDSAKTPGCSALYIASSRCAERIRTTSSSSIVSRSVMPSDGGDDRGGGAGDAVRGEHEVVRSGVAGEVAAHVVAHGVAEVAAGDLGAVVGEQVVAVALRPVQQLVGQLVVVLQRVHQRGGVDADVQAGAQAQPQELGVAGGQRVLVGGPGDEVVRQVRAGLAGGADVVDRQVQLLEGEAADLAHHARDEVVRRLGQRVPLRPGRHPVQAALGAEEAVGVEPQAPTSRGRPASAGRRRSPAASRRTTGPAS